MAEDRDWVAEATVQGWREGYDGPNAVDAQTFVEKGERIAPIAQGKLNELRTKSDEDRVQFESRIARLEGDNQAFGEYHEGLLQKEKARTAELLVQLEAKQTAAAVADDLTAYAQVTHEISQVRNDQVEAPPTNGGAQPNPLFDAWRINNDWYDKDPALRAMADGFAPEISQRGFRGPAYFSELTRVVKEYAPEKFGNPNRGGANTVESGGELETKVASDAHVYDNLDAEGKAACDRFIASGHTTKESFCASYDWE